MRSALKKHWKTRVFVSDSRNGRCWRGLMSWRHVTYALVVRGVPKPIFVVLAVATVVAVLAVTTTLGGTGFAAIG